MLRHAAPIEYSVFWLNGNPADRLRCLDDVLPLLDPDQDDLRMYSVPARGLKLRLGRAVFPRGIEWSALPEAFRWDSDEIRNDRKTWTIIV
jgi:CRISPR-associated protein Cas2